MPPNDELKIGDRGWWRTNQGVGAALSAILLVLLVYYLTQDWVFERLRDRFYLGAPTVTSVLWMLACALAMLFDKQRRQTTEGIGAFRISYLFMAFAIVGTAYLFFMGTEYLGFPLCLVVFNGAAMYVLGLRPMRTCIASGAIAAGVITLIFFVIGQRWSLLPILFGVGR